ncbi:MAG TPA: hypothetical protein VGR54_02870 [Nitrosopumilaceae archaeon]|nr:hypothetical protein [Nitrosopumilaceae archaeon]
MKYCPKCGKQNTMIFSDMEGEPFTLENQPSIPRGDYMHAGIDTSVTPLFSTCLCFDCDTWFGVFGLPPKGYEPKD